MSETITDTAPVLSDAERRHARHALGLGLGGRRRVSDRNHFVCDTHPTWEGLVARGLATVRRSSEPNGVHTYRLTRAGAEAALAPGERLDPEDFPAREEEPS